MIYSEGWILIALLQMTPFLLWPNVVPLFPLKTEAFLTVPFFCRRTWNITILVPVNKYQNATLKNKVESIVLVGIQIQHGKCKLNNIAVHPETGKH